METPATQGWQSSIPFLQPLPTGQSVMEGEAALLSGDVFLQMLADLGGAAPMPTHADQGLALPLPTQALATEMAAPEALPAQEPGSAVDAWLSFSAFVASGVPGQGSEESAPVSVEETVTDTAEAQTSVEAGAVLPTQFVVPAVAPPTTQQEVVGSGEPTVNLRESNAATLQALAAATARTAGSPPEGPQPESGPVIEDIAEVLSAGAGERPVSQGAASAGLTGNAAVVATAGAAAAIAGAPERAPAAPATSAASLQQQVHAPMRSARWADEVGQRVALMAVSGTQSGSLSLVPEQMGPIEVRIHMNQDTASVWFGASQADTRAALQEALPRLREMFAATGLSLGEAQVSQQAPRREGEAQAGARVGYGPDADAVAPEVQSVHRVRLGLVDTYA